MNVYNVRVCNVGHVCVHNVRKRFFPEENTRCQGNCVIYIYVIHKEYFNTSHIKN